MIQATELRIGNIITLNTTEERFPMFIGRPCSVKEMTFNTEYAITVRLADPQDLSEQVHAEFSRWTAYFEPIPLTPEILEKCGWEHEPAYYKWHGEVDLYQAAGVFRLCIDEFGALDLNIKYLHQLQNLFYALTGAELEVKL